MKSFLIYNIIFLLGISPSLSQKIYEYPYVYQDTVTNNYFGIKINDPYQWMENPDDEKLKFWIDQQKDFTKKQQRKYSRQNEIIPELIKIYDIKYIKNENIVNDTEIGRSKYKFKIQFNDFNSTPDLFYSRENGPIKLLFKSKDFKRSKDDKVFIENYETDPLERVIAVTISHAGSDWNEIYLFDLVSGNQLQESIKHTLGENLVWTDDGFFYTRYDSISDTSIEGLRKNQRICYHKIGTQQEDDKVIYYNPDTTGFRSFYYHHNYETKELYLYHPLKIRGAWFKAISSVSTYKIENFFLKTFLAVPEETNADFSVEAEKGDSLFIKTNLNSPKSRVVVVKRNQFNNLYDFIPEYSDNLTKVNLLGKDKLACFYFLNGSYSVLIHDFLGNILKVFEFPEGIKVNGFYANKDSNYSYYTLSSFYQPSIKYRVNLNTLETESLGRISINYNHRDYVTTYKTYTSKDGTEIPLYLTHLKNLKKDGKNPVLIYGYGGYGMTVEPNYKWENMMFILNGGILAVPNIRGGGAKGSDWAMAGRGINKQNSIDDFIAASDFLISENYTNPEKIVIEGGSHGAMIVAAAMTKKPANYKAVVAVAGIYDLLRHHYFTASTHVINHKEFGVSTNKEEFENLIKFSPLHNVEPQKKYPNVLLITGDNDTRVAPLHSYKFLATLQGRADRSSLYMLYINEKAGHQGTLIIEEYLKEIALKYGFIFNMLDMR